MLEPTTEDEATFSNLSSSTTNEDDPKDLEQAKQIINEMRVKCRQQTEQIMAWKKAYAIQKSQYVRQQKDKQDQFNTLTSQLLLLESRLIRKQKQIGNILCQREMTIVRQQKLIDTLSNRLLDHGLDALDGSGSVISLSGIGGGIHSISGYTDFDSLNDSDSAVVLEDIDLDSSTSPANSSSSLLMMKRSKNGASGDVTVVRSISDAIETNLNKYGSTRRSNCFLRRPDVLETVYSVEEDPEQQQQQQQQPQGTSNVNSAEGLTPADVNEKRDKFKHRSEKIVSDCLDENGCNGNTSATTGAASNHNNVDLWRRNHHQQQQHLRNQKITKMYDDDEGEVDEEDEDDVERQKYMRRSVSDGNSSTTSSASFSSSGTGTSGGYPGGGSGGGCCGRQAQVTNYNRVMSNHRSVTKPKDVKYKRINKAKSKSLEELRGRLKYWVERDAHGGASGLGVHQHQIDLMHARDAELHLQQQQKIMMAQRSYT